MNMYADLILLEKGRKHKTEGTLMMLIPLQGHVGNIDTSMRLQTITANFTLKIGNRCYITHF